MSRRRSQQTGSRPGKRGPASSQPPERSSGSSWLGIIVAFLAAALVAFGPALNAPFDFDDGPAIVQNTTIRTLWPPWAALHTPPLGTAVSGRPVVNVTFALNYALNHWIGITSGTIGESSASAAGFRLVNILLHVATTTVLLVLVRRTLEFGAVPTDIAAKAGPIATIVAGLWLIHPLQTEAVDYVSQRTELLVSLCYLTAMYAAMRHRQVLTDSDPLSANSKRASVRWFGVAVLASILGMASKEVMVTAPIVIALYDRAFFSASWRDVFRMRERRVLFVALAATIGITVALDLTNGRAGTVGLGLGISPLQYAVTQGWAIPRYLHLAFWPDALTYDYGQTPLMGRGPVLGLLAVVSAGIATLMSWRSERWRWIGFLGAFFFLVLAPSSSIVPIRTEVAAERRIYLALAAVVTVVVVGGVRAITWVEARRRAGTSWWDARAFAAFGSVAVIYFAVSGWTAQSVVGAQVSQVFVRLGVALAATIALVVIVAARRRWVRAAPLALLMASMLIISCRRSSLYRSPEALWIDAARKMPGNARAYDNIGAAMLRESPPRYDSADSLFVRAIALDSTFIEPRRRRASVAIAQGRAGDAEQLLLHVLNIAPNDSAAISMLGKVYLVAREPARALPYLRRIANESSDPSAFGDLGNAFVMMGQLDSAAAALRLAILRNPNNPDPLRWLGAALVEAGRGSEAVPYLERSLTLDSTSGVAYGLLSIAFGQARWADSAEHAAAAASIHASGNAVVLVLAGRGLQAAGRVEQAIPYYAAAIQLTPNDPEALTRFGIAEASLGHAREAVTLFNRALAASPNYPPALQALRAMHRTSVASP